MKKKWVSYDVSSGVQCVMKMRSTAYSIMGYSGLHPRRCVRLLFLTALFLGSVSVDARIAVSPLARSVTSTKPDPVPVEPRIESLDVFRQGAPVLEDLQSPDGIALDEKSGVIYVSEEDPARIVRIRPDGSRKVVFDASTPVYERNGISKKRVSGLRSPEGVALDKSGNLYVVEDIPGGRLISFKIVQRSSNPRPYGIVVPLPIENRHIAWESIDVGPVGALLLAGSTIEFFPRNVDQEGLFRGVILYRDAQGVWWSPMDDALTSYSAASFSPDGKSAYFACEVTGDVGCMDLESHILRTYHADRIFKSPEGLCVLPDGSALVAEEAGRIYRLNPGADTLQLLYDNEGTIESVVWDETRRRLLVTDDQQGLLVSVELKSGLELSSSSNSIRRILFESQSTPVEMIPDQCPLYLSRILKVGGYNPDQSSSHPSFEDFARKYCLVAIDAEAMLLSSAKPVKDPFKRIQLVIVAPYLMGIQTGQLLWSSSGFAAVRESGEILKTELIQRQILGGDLLERSCTPVGGQTVALPMPFSARVSADGVASVNFMGMGVTPDFYLILNTVEPDDSYMVVIQAGSVQQYALHLPPYYDRNHWVVALKRTEPDVWKSLSFK